MKISDLTVDECRQRLAAAGLTFRTGPFVYTIRTDLQEVAPFMAQAYAEHPVIDRAPFSDFHLAIHASRKSLQPWLGQVTVSAGGVPLFSPFPRQEALAYLEWGMNGCLARTAHHLLLFHAASLEADGRAVLFLGQSGTGKSTLAAALALRGWRLLSDEFGLVALDSFRCIPLARPICLKNEAIGLLRSWDPTVVMTPSAEVRRKGLLCHMPPPPASVRRMEEPATPAALIFLNFQAGAAVLMEEVPKAEAMKRAMACSFNYKVLGRAGFDRLAQLVDTCACRQLTYGNLADAERALATAL